MDSDKISIFTDGGSRGNPGPAAAAFVVFKNDEKIYSFSKFLGISTNNYSEYYALFMAVDWVRKNFKIANLTCVDFYLDSELVVKQMKGIYKVKNVNIKKIFININRQLSELPITYNFFHIYRNGNKFADKLVNLAIDEKS